jgi:uncharacterized membrane protein (DUF2068 family)
MLDPTLSPPTATRQPDGMLRLIALGKLAEGLLILCVAIGVLRLVHHDVAAMAARWVAAFKVDPHNEYIHRALEGLGLLDDRRLRELSAGSFVYAGVRLVEGVGLWMRKRWAEYFVVIATGALVPLEIVELARRATFPKAAVLVINLAIIAYLVAMLRRGRNHERHELSAEPDVEAGDRRGL